MCVSSHTRFVVVYNWLVITEVLLSPRYLVCFVVVMGDSLSEIVTGIVGDLVIDAVNCSKNSGEKGKALRKGSFDMWCEI